MRGGARPGAGRKPVEAKKVRLSLYVKPETLDLYRRLRARNKTEWISFWLETEIYSFAETFGPETLRDL